MQRGARKSGAGLERIRRLDPVEKIVREVLEKAFGLVETVTGSPAITITTGFEPAPEEDCPSAW